MNRLRLVSSLRKFVKEHPLASNMVLYGGLYAGGDLSQQTIQRPEKHDFRSALRVGLVGALVIGPFNFRWYKILDAMVKGSGKKVIVKKIVLDQVLAGPIDIILFYLATSIIERQDDVTKELRDKGLQTFWTGCVFWPTAQIVNFAFLPTHWRAPYVGVAAFVWCNILTFIKSLDIDELYKQS